MQHIKHLFRRFLSWIGAAALLLGLSACGGINKDAYSMPTDVERLYTTAAQLEATTESARDRALPSDRYVWAYTSEDGNLTLSVNATVTAPNAPLTMRHISAEGFAQAQITGIFDYLFAEQYVTATLGENVLTKAELQSRLDQMNQTLADGSYAELGFAKAEYEEAIRRQEIACQSAPAAISDVRVATDGTLLTARDADEGDYQALTARNDASDTLVVRSAAADNRSQLPSSCAYDRYDAPEYSMLDAISVEADGILPQGTQSGPNLSYDEAKNLSDGLFSAAGVEVSLLAAFVISDRQAGNADGVVKEAAHYAYEFQYLRVVGGVPVASDSWTDDNSASGFPWDQEQITIIVDDAGIAQVR